MADEDDDLDLDGTPDPEDGDDDDQGTPGQDGDDQEGDDVDDQDDATSGDNVDTRSQDRRPQDQRPPSRRERRIDALIESNRQKDQQLAETNRRLDLLLQGRTNQPQGETREQRDARRQQMSPEDRMFDVLAEHTEAWGREKQVLTLGMADQMDKAAFDAKCSVDTVYQKRQTAVEDKLRELRSKGMTAPREEVLRWVIGDQALKAAGSKEVKSQRKEAAQRVRKQQARPSQSNGSDVRADRGRQTSRERRLENVQI